jgi:hypothetical protein
MMGIWKDMWRRAQGTGINLCGGCWGASKRPHFLGTYVLKKALETGISLHRRPIENHGGGGGVPFTRDSEKHLKEGSGNRASLPLWQLCEGNLERGAPLEGTLKVMYRRLWGQASLSIGAPLGNLEGGLYLFEGALMMGTWREGSFTGDPEGYVK